MIEQCREWIIQLLFIKNILFHDKAELFVLVDENEEHTTIWKIRYQKYFSSNLL
jgi:hypothetical protein